MGVYQMAPLPRDFTAEQAQTRIEDYFKLCESDGLRPGVEGLAMAFKVSSRTLHNWKQGIFRPELKDVITLAFQFIAAYLEHISLHGKLNPATSCFLYKNWLGYKDTVTTETVDVKPRFGEELSDEQIAELIED